MADTTYFKRVDKTLFNEDFFDPSDESSGFTTSDTHSMSSSSPTSDIFRRHRDSITSSSLYSDTMTEEDEDDYEYDVQSEGTQVRLEVPQIRSNFSVDALTGDNTNFDRVHKGSTVREDVESEYGEEETRPRRQKRVDALEVNEEKEKIRRRNRVAQAKVRANKKKAKKDMEKEVDFLTNELDVVKRRLAAVLAENDMLKEQNDFLKSMLGKEDEFSGREGMLMTSSSAYSSSNQSSSSSSSSTPFVFFAFSLSFFIFDVFYFNFMQQANENEEDEETFDTTSTSSSGRVLLSLLNPTPYLTSKSSSFAPFLVAIITAVAIKFLMTQGRKKMVMMDWQDSIGRRTGGGSHHDDDDDGKETLPRTIHEEKKRKK